MTHTITITVPADETQDDCLTAAADAYVAEHPEADGWDLSPRWADETREAVALDVPVEVDTDDYLDTTYTIRRPGCSAWREEVRATELADELRHANDRVRGHIIVGESGTLEGQEVALSDVVDALREAGCL